MQSDNEHELKRYAAWLQSIMDLSKPVSVEAIKKVLDEAGSCHETA
ncbi:MAG: hypothetical protein GXY67_09845 [Clostridiales bacterium]|nr:hypothetical protein [Clostridiales bacterium]